MWGNEFTAGFDGAGIGDLGGGAGGGTGTGGGAGGGEAAGGGAGIFAIIAAVIAAQMGASNNTDNTNYGQEASNWFTFDDDGHYEPGMTTEPWMEWLYSELGWESTPGAKFDAAMWGDEASEGDMWRNLPGAADYYADPIRSWLGYNTWNNLLGEWSDNEDLNKVLATLIDPIGGIMNQIGEWFD